MGENTLILIKMRQVLLMSSNYEFRIKEVKFYATPPKVMHFFLLVSDFKVISFTSCRFFYSHERQKLIYATHKCKLRYLHNCRSPNHRHTGAGNATLDNQF